MNVLNVNNMLDPITGGGAAERTFQMSRALSEAGVQCTVLTTNVGLTDERIAQLGSAEVVACPCVSKRFFIPGISLRSITEIVRRADVIHIMGHWSVLNALVYRAAKRMKKPYVVCPAGSLPLYGRSKTLKKIYNWAVGRKLIRDAQVCIAITSAEIPQMQSYGVSTEKIQVIPNGIMLDDLPAANPKSFREKYALGSAPIVLFVGRLNQIKGPDLLLQAFCNLKDVLANYQLVFVGPDAGMRAMLEETAIRQNVENRVRFLGFIGGAEKYQAYFASDLLVIPSRQEAMSIVILEAAATGTPVLLTDQCGFDEAAECGGGKVVPASVSGLEEGLRLLLEGGADLARMGERLKTFVNRTYSWERLVERYVDLYRSYLSEIDEVSHNGKRDSCRNLGYKILVVSQYFRPENFRINDLVLGLKARGHNMSVLTGIPNYPGGKIFPGYTFFSPTKESQAGVSIRRVPLVPRGNGKGWRLVLNYLSFAFSASLLGPLRVKGPFDVIIVYEPSPVTVGIPALVMKWVKKAPILFWVGDPWPETLSATGAVTSPRVLAMVRTLVRFIYRRCDHILVQSRAFIPAIEKLGEPRNKIKYFPNSAEALYSQVIVPENAPERALIHNSFTVMFAGNIGTAQDFPTIIAAAEKLRDKPDIQWVILGDGRMRNWVEQEIKARALDANFHLLGQHPIESMPQFFSLADVMLVTLKRHPIFSLTIPSKVQSYLACAKPIVAALDGEGARVIEESGAGRVAPPEDANALAQAVLEIYRMSADQRARMGASGLGYFQINFERNMLLERLEGWMRELIEETRACAS